MWHFSTPFQVFYVAIENKIRKIRQANKTLIYEVKYLKFNQRKYEMFEKWQFSITSNVKKHSFIIKYSALFLEHCESIKQYYSRCSIYLDKDFNLLMLVLHDKVLNSFPLVTLSMPQQSIIYRTMFQHEHEWNIIKINGSLTNRSDSALTEYSQSLCLHIYQI